MCHGVQGALLRGPVRPPCLSAQPDSFKLSWRHLVPWLLQAQGQTRHEVHVVPGLRPLFTKPFSRPRVAMAMPGACDLKRKDGLDVGPACLPRPAPAADGERRPGVVSWQHLSSHRGSRPQSHGAQHTWCRPHSTPSRGLGRPGQRQGRLRESWEAGGQWSGDQLWSQP